MFKTLKTLVSLILFPAQLAFAATDKVTEPKLLRHSYWAGSNAQLGLVVNTGNTNTSNLAGGAIGIYTNEAWMNNIQFNLQLIRSLGQFTKERYYTSDQLQYNFSKEHKNFVYGNVNFINDRFSPYQFQTISSLGYGRDLLNFNTFTLTVQAGPGIRYESIRHQSRDQKNFITYTATNIGWQIAKSVKLNEELQYTFGHPYNYLQSVAALTNKILGNIAMQVSYTLQYYSVIPFGSKNTEKVDTITNVALVYNF